MPTPVGREQVRRLVEAGAQICGTATAGSITINGSVGFVLIGDAGDDQCAPNSIGGALNLQRNTGGVEAIGNAVTGATTNTANSGRGPSPKTPPPRSAEHYLGHPRLFW